MTTLAAWQLVLPTTGRFTHLTAAGLHGLWLPPLPVGLPVFAAIDQTQSRPQRAGLRCYRVTEPHPMVLMDGLWVDDVPETLLACARHLCLLDLVVLVDSALHLDKCTREDLETVAGRRRRGAPRLRLALELADGRSESLWETLLRRLHETCAIAVEPQYRLLDATGTEVARADLWVVGTNALHEYDGEEHLKRPRQRKDLARARRINNIDWLRRGYTNVEVLHQAVSILRDADLSLGREHRPERIRTWHRMVSQSLVTPSGRHRLLQVLGLVGETGDEQHAETG